MAENNYTNNIVLEITKKLTPRLLALILIVTLIALTLVISLTLYRGGSVNLKDMTFDVPDNQNQTISSLEENLEKWLIMRSKKEIDDDELASLIKTRKRVVKQYLLTIEISSRARLEKLSIGLIDVIANKFIGAIF